MAGIKDNIMKTNHVILIIISVIMIIAGMWILLNYPQSIWGLILPLTFTASLGAGLHNLEKELKRYDQQNRNKQFPKS